VVVDNEEAVLLAANFALEEEWLFGRTQQLGKLDSLAR